MADTNKKSETKFADMSNVKKAGYTLRHGGSYGTGKLHLVAGGNSECGHESMTCSQEYAHGYDSVPVDMLCKRCFRNGKMAPPAAEPVEHEYTDAKTPKPVITKTPDADPAFRVGDTVRIADTAAIVPDGFRDRAGQIRTRNFDSAGNWFYDLVVPGANVSHSFFAEHDLVRVVRVDAMADAGIVLDDDGFHRITYGTFREIRLARKTGQKHSPLAFRAGGWEYGRTTDGESPLAFRDDDKHRCRFCGATFDPADTVIQFDFWWIGGERITGFMHADMNVCMDKE